MSATVTKITEATKYSHKNPRVRRVFQNTWQVERMAKFGKGVKWASAAKSARTAMGITQKEIETYLGYGQGNAARWESGSYFGWNAKSLSEYINACQELAVTKEE